MIKILIADDESSIRVLTHAVFREMGMDVTLAIDGEDAIQKIKDVKPDIVISDVVMPNKSGFEVCHFIRSTPEFSDTPILLLSAMGDEYNKITGFEEGADDYVTKPFSIDELKARVKALLVRQHRPKPVAPEDNKDASSAGIPSVGPSGNDGQQVEDLSLIKTGLAALDDVLSGGLPKGSNILVLGPIGRGKSSFGRQFVCEGLTHGERCLFVAIDDSPNRIRKDIERTIKGPIDSYVEKNIIQFVDAYSWSGIESPGEESPFSVKGALDLNQLSGAIIDASMAIGQCVQTKSGGRRVIDSISSLLVHFDLPSSQRFITQIARTAVAFGDVTTLFILEDGSVNEQVLNNIKYLMDGVIEFGKVDGKRAIRIQSMKWAAPSTQWQFT
jgi:DNA-binding response OmpR family regulator/KaiC/GvpD/RAD55 family RecA-like ATPase